MWDFHVHQHSNQNHKSKFKKKKNNLLNSKKLENNQSQLHQRAPSVKILQISILKNQLKKYPSWK